MSPAYTTKEQFERWHIRDCARCGRRAAKAANWEGPICRTCFDHAVHTWGSCPACGTHRLLPGRRQAGEDVPVCRDCAAITRDFFCARCGFEGCLLGGRLCERCTLADKLTQALDDGTGQLRPELVPLRDGILGSQNLKRKLAWFGESRVPEVLAALARGDLRLTHEALAALPDWRTASSIRELLMHHGVLPRMDRQLMLFERWLAQRLVALEPPEHAQLVHRFATWNELRRLRRKAEDGPLRSTTTNESRQRINRAADFLAWLADHDISLDHCTQAALDAWHSEHYTTRRPAQAFLRWAMRSGAMPKLTWVWKTTTNPTPMAQHLRLALIRRLVADQTIPLRERTAGLLVLIYAQPLSRVVQMTIHDVITSDNEVLLRIGDPPTPAPGPLADLLRALLAERAAFSGPNKESTWLFPGRRAGQPLQHRSLGQALHRHGILVQAGRTSAIRQLVLQAPAPVVARMLGFHDKHTTRVLIEAGGNWNRYAPGDHDQ